MDDLQEVVLFDRFNPFSCFRIHEVLPGEVRQGMDSYHPYQDRFRSELDLKLYIQRRIFGKKKPCEEDTSVQDWLYLFPSKLAMIKTLREKIMMLACNIQKHVEELEHPADGDRAAKQSPSYPGPELLQRIIDADLVVGTGIKILDNSQRFTYKFNSLPINPTINLKKRIKERKK